VRSIFPATIVNRMRLLRLKPFDESTESGRSQERHRRLALSAAASALSKCVALAATLMSIPLALHYLGPERFGIWSTFSALLVTLQFADLGIGNGIVNTVSTAHGSRDIPAIRGYISSGAFVLFILAAILFLTLPLVVSNVSWGNLFKLQDVLARNEVAPAVAAFLACVAIGIPLGVVQRVQIALQQSYIASLWQAAANLFSLLGIALAASFQMSLMWLTLALLGAPLIAALANTLYFFGRSHAHLRPQFRMVTVEASRTIAKTAGSFLIIQVAVAITFTSDTIIIAHVLGASEVANFSIPEKMFSVSTLLLSTILNPLWPAYSEAISRGDSQWVSRTLKRSLILSVSLAGGISLLILLMGIWLSNRWVGDSVTLSMSLLLSFAVWKIVEALGTAIGMFLNGAGIIRFQLIICCVMALCTFLVKPAMVREFGLAGAPMATTVIYTVIALIPLAVFLKSMVRGVHLIPGIPNQNARWS
jgi:O-antigen/teichoic acid export membrane protein